MHLYISGSPSEELLELADEIGHGVDMGLQFSILGMLRWVNLAQPLGQRSKL